MKQNTNWGFLNFHPAQLDLEKKVLNYWVDFYSFAEKEFIAELTPAQRKVFLSAPSWLRNEIFSGNIHRDEFFRQARQLLRERKRRRKL